MINGEEAPAFESQRATITLTCAGVGAPLQVRVRRALKNLLRTHGLRALAVDLAPTKPADVPLARPPVTESPPMSPQVELSNGITTTNNPSPERPQPPQRPNQTTTGRKKPLKGGLDRHE